METKEGKETLLSQPPTEPRGVLVLRIDRAPCSPLILINCEIDPLPPILPAQMPLVAPGA